MSKFGWSYPAGAANDPFAPYNQEEGPCEVCGQFVDDCLCPECGTCNVHGDPACYTEHGLTRTPEQIESLARAHAHWEEAVRAGEQMAAEWAANNG